MLVDEGCVTGVELDAVAHQLAAYHLDLFADHMLGPGQQVGGGDPLLDPVARAVHLALVHSGQVEDGLAQRLGRDGAGIHAHPAEHATAFDHGNRLAKLRCGDRGLLPARTRTDDDEVVFQTHEEKTYAAFGDLAG